MITIRLPYEAPPLRSNRRGMHWGAKHRLVTEIRTTSKLLASAWLRASSQEPLGWLAGQVSVTLVWEVTDKRVRDVGASAPTLKAALDGIVDAGMLARDSHHVVAEERNRIEVGTRKGVRIEIRPWKTDERPQEPR